MCEKIKTVNETYYYVLYDYVFGKNNPSIYDIAMGGAYSDMAKRRMKWEKDEEVLINKASTLYSDMVTKGKIEKHFAKNKIKNADDAKSVTKQIVAKAIIETEISNLLEHNSDLMRLNVNDKQKRQQCFINWHCDICNKIKKTMADGGVDSKEMTFGMAQKWLNMTLKNTLVSEIYGDDMRKIKSLLHCPIDSFVIQAADDLGKSVEWTWSTLDDEGLYRKFQISLAEKLEKIEEISAIDWEMRIWPIYKRLGSNKGKKDERMKAAYDSRIDIVKRYIMEE